MLLFLVLYSIHSAAQPCFNPDGTFTSTDIACSPNSNSSACCGEGGVCYSNGLCEYTDDLINGSIAMDYQRASCTDKTWKAAECFGWCSEPWHGGSEAVRPCDGISTGLRYCCALGLENSSRIDDYSCCLTPSNIFTIAAAATPIAIIASGTSVPIGTNSSATVETPNQSPNQSSTQSPNRPSTQSPNQSSTQSPTASNAQSTAVGGSGGLNTGDWIAVGIGIPATIAAFATIWQLVVMLRRRRRRRSS